MLRWGCFAATRWISSQVLSLECPSMKIISVPNPISGVRCTAASMFPASLRAGITTEHIYCGRAAGCGFGRATKATVTHKMRRQRRHPAVQQRRHQRRARRPHHAGIRLDDFPTRQMQQVHHVIGRKPVLQQGRRFHPHFFRRLQDRPPKVVEKINHQPRVRSRDRLQPLQHGLDVRQVVDEIGQNDVIELFGRRKLQRIRPLKFQLRVTLPGELDHFRAEIHPHTAARFHGCQQISQPAPDFEHAQSRWHEKTEIFAQRPLGNNVRFPRARKGARWS